MNFHDHFQLLSPTPNSMKKLKKIKNKLKKRRFKKKRIQSCMHDFNRKG